MEAREWIALADGEGYAASVPSVTPRGQAGTVRRGEVRDVRWTHTESPGCFLFLDGPTRTYRIVFDPTSELNLEVLRRLRLQRPDGNAV